MKKILSFFAIAALFMGVACTPKEDPIKLVDVNIQLECDGQALAISGVNVVVNETSGTASYNAETDAAGVASFKLPVGIYNAAASTKSYADGIQYVYNGAITYFAASEEQGVSSINMTMTKVASQQIIIKELYTTGCPADEEGKSYNDDNYVILYNNSDADVDATDIVFGFLAPYNAHGTNKYYVDDKLLYEDQGWIPAYGAIWWFTAPVTIPAYSQIVVAQFAAIDHTQTYSKSVDLSKPEYYWMSNIDLAAYTNKKYAASENIPASHYLTAAPYTQGNAWAVSNMCPAFFIGKMAAAEAKAISEDVANYDLTLGEKPAFYVVKFPQANVVDAVDVWSEANVAKSSPRFPAAINTGHVALTNKLGYTVYRNVDKAATEALPENAGLLVTGYADDPSGIDAEASIKAGAHIIYSDTNNSETDFHIRKVSSLK